MKICVFGAGAIGGLIGAKLALAGEDVTLIARGPHLAAMKANGLKLISEGQTHVVRPRITGDPREAGQQDCVVLSVKVCATRLAEAGGRRCRLTTRPEDFDAFAAAGCARFHSARAR